MTVDRTIEYLQGLLRELRALPQETEWVEFKQDYYDPQDIGEYISALSNSATLCGKAAGYLVWGIENRDHKIVGTSFRPKKEKKAMKSLKTGCSGFLLLKFISAFMNLKKKKLI